MKRIFIIALMALVFPGTLCAARLQCTLPPDIPKAYLLSGGTFAMMDYIKAGYNTEISKLRAEYQIDSFEQQVKKAEGTAKAKKQAYADKVSSLRRSYLSLLNFSIHSVQSSINPATSTLGDVMFFYTAKNNSDRIITDIIYKPIFNGKGLSTTTSLVLEFMDPLTLKSGLGARESITNLGHDPEKFSFFIGEISAEELKGLRTDFGKKFSISIIDMHFSRQKGYKGQIKPETFEEAFSGQLNPIMAAYRQAETETKALKESGSRASRGYTAQKGIILSRLKKSLNDLRESSIRYTALPDKKRRYIFEDVAPGDYFIYAGNGRGSAAVEKITIGEKNRKETYTRMKKDPFVP